MKSEYKRGGKLDTTIDVSQLEPQDLKRLRKKADAMGLRDLVTRIDDRRTAIKVVTGKVNERELAYFNALGRYPLPDVQMGKYPWHEIDTRTGRFLVEVEEEEMQPPPRSSLAGINPGAAMETRVWVWEKSGAQSMREAAEMRAEKDKPGLAARESLIEDLSAARSMNLQVVAVLFKPTRSGGKNYRALEVEGRVGLVNIKTGALRIDFFRKGYFNRGEKQ